jgi:16S rRNA (adenine1518-N6/adenine1519-N6)-dimethyltransferase
MATHAPRKRFGQNFLEDAAVIGRIIESIRPLLSDRIVEIGPGLAALTRPLLDCVERLDVVEIDRDIVQDLRRRFPPNRLTVHEGDVLEFDFTAIGEKIRVVGNLPYNISTPILFRLSEQAGAIKDCHFMLQREVVRRMTAPAGSPDYGRLSVMLQYKWSVESLFDVPAAAFRPQPKVWSSVVRMIPHEVLPHRAIEEGVFARVVALAFGQRRKTLRNALAPIAGSEQLLSMGIDPGARGETLGVAEFVRIANGVSASARQV